MSETNPPTKEFRAGTVVAAIWTETAATNGRPVPSYSIRIQKRYRDDKSGQWKTTSYFRPDELPKLALVVSRAFEFLTLRETEAVSSVPAS
ncbi:MAG: hypothetical protein C4523_13070 [Myxococcales bacterium]|nr:MAG: hypothetical protein C4523_13070 [Myxococcales bacterium]